MKVYVVVIIWNTSLDYHGVDEHRIDSVYRHKEDAQKRVDEIEGGINIAPDLLHTYEYVKEGGIVAEDIFFSSYIEELELK